jgi:hypothetical protein
MIKLSIVIALASAIAAVEKQLELPIARLTLRAIEEEGRPIAGATVEMSFQEAFPHWGGGKLIPVVGSTDGDGRFIGEGHSLDTKGGVISKDGYYSSSPESFKFKTVAHGKWQPWNPTLDVVMKKIIRPTPLFARFKHDTELPSNDEPVGFDLEESDWLPPFGHGKSADFVFKLTKRVSSFHDFGAELLLTFANKGDGIQGMVDNSKGASRLRSAHEAPDTGYAPSLSLLQGNSIERGEYGTKNDARNFWFRVRAVLDERGQVVSALYGKIYDGIEYFPVKAKTAKLRFTYYINPIPNDRGLEFDSKRNLFLQLEDVEKPVAP